MPSKKKHKSRQHATVDLRCVPDDPVHALYAAQIVVTILVIGLVDFFDV